MARQVAWSSSITSFLVSCVTRLTSIPDSKTSAPPTRRSSGMVSSPGRGRVPLEEVAHGPAGGGAVGQRLVQVCLRQVAQRLTAVVQPGQQVEGGQDTGPREIGRSPGEGPPGCVPAGAAEHEPVHEGPDQPGMVGWLIVQHVLQPGRQALQVLVACGQDARADQYLPDIAPSSRADRLAPSHLATVAGLMTVVSASSRGCS